MARTDIARVVARAVLEGVVEADTAPELGVTPDVVDEIVSALLGAAIIVKRRRMNNVGEVVELVFAVPPDPSTPED